MTWITRKLPSVSSEDLEKTLSGSQQLLHQHQVSVDSCLYSERPLLPDQGIFTSCLDFLNL